MGGGRAIRGTALAWAVVTCLIAGVVGAVGYWTGIAVQDDREAQASPQSAPALLPLGQVYASARREAFTRGRLAGARAERLRYQPGGQGFARIFRRAQRVALGGPALRPRGWYVIAATPDGQAVARRFVLESGRAYALCRGGAAVCAHPLAGRVLKR